MCTRLWERIAGESCLDEARHDVERVLNPGLVLHRIQACSLKTCSPGWKLLLQGLGMDSCISKSLCKRCRLGQSRCWAGEPCERQWMM